MADAADADRLAVTATRAFANDPLMRWFYPNANDYAREVPALFRSQAMRLTAWGYCFTTTDGVAMAGWEPPQHPQVDIASPPADHPQERLERFAAIGDALRTNHPDESLWYLQILATHPDWQRQGLGAALLAAGTAAADADGLPCYLETQTEENAAYYLRHGFVVRSEWDLPLGGPHMWGMIRPAR